MSRRDCLPLWIGVLLLSACHVAAGQPWPRFRGPNGAGQSDAAGIPVSWTSDDYRWRVELPGIGDSSPVVWNDRIYVSSAMQEDGRRILRCLNTADGQTIWKRSFSVATFGMGNATAYDSSSPAVDEDRVYMAWATPEQYIVLALEKTTGRESWRRDLGPFQGDHGFGASPIVYGDLLIVANDQTGPSFLIALEGRTGESRWKVDRRHDKTAYSTPIVYRPKGGEAELIFTCSAHGVSSFDPATGRLNWELAGVFGAQRIVGSPVAACGLIFASCGTGGGGKRMVVVRPADADAGTKAEIAYEFEGSLPYVPTPVAHGKLLFFFSDSGVVTCADAPTGKIHWRERVGGRFFGSPIRVADRLYCISREGELVVLAAADEYKLLSRLSLEGPSHSTPVVADGVMYLRTRSHLMALGRK